MSKLKRISGKECVKILCNKFGFRVARQRGSHIVLKKETGWRELRLEKALELYRNGKASVDKTAKIAGLTVSEMMEEIAASGIKSEETIEEYKQGIKTLLNAN